MVIPARILANWDFFPRKVLVVSSLSPCVDVSSFSIGTEKLHFFKNTSLRIHLENSLVNIVNGKYSVNVRLMRCSNILELSSFTVNVCVIQQRFFIL